MFLLDTSLFTSDSSVSWLSKNGLHSQKQLVLQLVFAVYSTIQKGKDIGDLYIPLQYPVCYQIELMVNIILARVQLSLVLLRWST